MTMLVRNSDLAAVLMLAFAPLDGQVISMFTPGLAGVAAGPKTPARPVDRVRDLG